ncbi:hypothetical protein JJL45_05250 [Tamlana sp. s12]|uniref:hypothetical protein n=1 Tax=Tamlana sp. s12 TaxID=1630406 RepID=UPI0007FB9647|nr:hypothetical protein [Tamlana sp. s12]OBQ56089.1 hypothetical protein VQ01_06810 [Tamlana sp. s12]QQY83398.1 hypothetical protein JJL45_05250 [Tamlana sp. s12]
MPLFEKIKTWSEMPEKQRYTFFYGVVIVALASVIGHDHLVRIPQIEQTHENTLRTDRDRCSADVIYYKEKAESIAKSFSDYLQKNEKEVRTLLYNGIQLNRKAEKLEKK